MTSGHAILRPVWGNLRGQFFVATLILAASGVAQQSTPFVEKYIAEARAAMASGDRVRARRSLELVSERAYNHLTGTLLMAELNLAEGKKDGAVVALVRIVERGAQIENATPNDVAAVKRARELLQEHDANAKNLMKMTERLRTVILDEAERLIKAKLWIGGQRLVNRHDGIAGPSNRSKKIRQRISQKGPDDIAKEDIHGGLGPLDGVSADWIAKEDEKHEAWESRWLRDTEHYRVETNAGYEVLVTACVVMEQFHALYREFYGVSKRRKTPSIPVRIFSTQEAFIDYAPKNHKESGGYYTGREIVTYDSGFDSASRMSLWETLAHEASHQFTRLVSKGWQPAWMNEGTASFFEGVKILSNGNVVHNIIPRAHGRLERHVSHAATEKRIKLRALLGTRSGLSNYTGTHYAYGWALIHFLYNYTDETGRPVYRDLLHKYMKAGFRMAPKPDKHVADFEKNIVLAARHPPIKTLDAFETVWLEFMKRRSDIENGRVDPVAEWLTKARASMHLKGKRPRQWAAEMIARVLSHTPTNPEALLIGIDLAWKTKKKDDDRALDRCLRFLDTTPASSRDKQQERVIMRIINTVDSAATSRERRLRTIAKNMERLVDGYVEKKMPRRALQVLRALQEIWPDNQSLSARADKLKAENGITTGRWRLLFNERDIRGWTFADMDDNTWKVLEDELVSEYGELATASKGIDYRLLFSRSRLEGDFSFSARMAADARRGCKLMGICFGIRDSEDFKAVIWFPEDGVLDLARYNGENLLQLTRKNVPARGRGNWVDVAIVVKAGRVSISLNGKVACTRSMDQAATDGAIGLIMGGGRARFKHLRMLIRDSQLTVEGSTAH